MLSILLRNKFKIDAGTKTFDMWGKLINVKKVRDFQNVLTLIESQVQHDTTPEESSNVSSISDDTLNLNAPLYKWVVKELHDYPDESYYRK